MKNFAFYVSNNATRLIKFLNRYKKHKIIEQIRFILIDNKNNKVLKKICFENNIHYYEINYSNIIDKNQYISNLFLNYLEIFKIDFGFIFADRILKGELLIEYKNRLINFHPSLLPSHKGLYAIDQALSTNTFLLGNTAHIVTNELDSGNVVMQNIFPAINFQNYDDILDKQLIMLLQLMLWIDENRLMVDKKHIKILNATYNIDEFIPNLEIENG